MARKAPSIPRAAHISERVSNEDRREQQQQGKRKQAYADHDQQEIVHLSGANPSPLNRIRNLLKSSLNPPQRLPVLFNAKA
jgi:hypothetical protein